MSSRRLARTVVEGGRSGGSKYWRRVLAQTARRWRMDAEGEYSPPNQKDSYGREFADRISVLRRWLESRVGRPWNDVYSEFLRENDPRTMKGWHLHTHLAFMVSGAGFQEGTPVHAGIGYRVLCVDVAGILQRGQLRRYDDSAFRSYLKEEERAKTWANGRAVVTADGTWYWAKRKIGPLIGPLTPSRLAIIKWKQSGRMSRVDESIWLSFSDRVRRELTVEI